MSTAYFDSLFAIFGVPPLMSWHGDRDQWVHYEDGRIQADVRAVIQDRQTIERELTDGVRVKLDLCTIIFSTDGESGLGSVANPQLCAVYTFDGAKWIVDLDGEQQGIDAVTGNLARIKLRKMMAVAQGYPNLYKRS